MDPLNIHQEREQGGFGVENMMEDEFSALSSSQLTPGLTPGTELRFSRISYFLTYITVSPAKFFMGSYVSCAWQSQTSGHSRRP